MWAICSHSLLEPRALQRQPPQRSCRQGCRVALIPKLSHTFQCTWHQRRTIRRHSHRTLRCALVCCSRRCQPPGHRTPLSQHQYFSVPPQTIPSFGVLATPQCSVLPLPSKHAPSSVLPSPAAVPAPTPVGTGAESVLRRREERFRGSVQPAPPASPPLDARATGQRKLPPPKGWPEARASGRCAQQASSRQGVRSCKVETAVWQPKDLTRTRVSRVPASRFYVNWYLKSIVSPKNKWREREGIRVNHSTGPPKFVHW